MPLIIGSLLTSAGALALGTFGLSLRGSGSVPADGEDADKLNLEDYYGGEGNGGGGGGGGGGGNGGGGGGNGGGGGGMGGGQSKEGEGGGGNGGGGSIPTCQSITKYGPDDLPTVLAFFDQLKPELLAKEVGGVFTGYPEVADGTVAPLQGESWPQYVARTALLLSLARAGVPLEFTGPGGCSMSEVSAIGDLYAAIYTDLWDVEPW